MSSVSRQGESQNAQAYNREYDNAGNPAAFSGDFHRAEVVIPQYMILGFMNINRGHFTCNLLGLGSKMLFFKCRQGSFKSPYSQSIFGELAIIHRQFGLLPNAVLRFSKMPIERIKRSQLFSNSQWCEAVPTQFSRIGVR